MPGPFSVSFSLHGSPIIPVGPPAVTADFDGPLGGQAGVSEQFLAVGKLHYVRLGVQDGLLRRDRSSVPFFFRARQSSTTGCRCLAALVRQLRVAERKPADTVGGWVARPMTHERSIADGGQPQQVALKMNWATRFANKPGDPLRIQSLQA